MKIAFFLLFFTSNLYANITNQSELSVVAARGNNNFATYRAKTETKFDYAKFNVSAGGDYTLATISDPEVEVARNWDLFVKAGRYLNPKFDVFGRSVIEGNEFAGIESRVNTDIGFTFIRHKTETLKLEYELAYRYSVEDPMEGLAVHYDNRIYAKVTYGNVFNENLSYHFWLEVIPNLTRGEDYVIAFAPSIQSKMTTHFSLKVEIEHLYDNLPAISTLRKHDTAFTTSFLANF
jgi:hypothetical protein